MSGQTSIEYIQHHLTYLTAGEGFWTFNLDTFFFSVLCGFLFLAIFRKVAKKQQQVYRVNYNVLLKWL